MADLLEWHRRDARPEWLTYFRWIGEFDNQDFTESGECIGGLSPAELVGTKTQSNIWRFKFAPQEHKFSEGDKVYDPELAREALFKDRTKFPKPVQVGTILNIDDVEGTIEVTRSKKNPMPTATAFHPETPISTADIQRHLCRLAQALLDEAAAPSGARYRGAIALLRRDVPRFRDGASLKPQPKEKPSDQFSRLAAKLDHSYLVVQGPPGSGKTWALSRAVLECVLADQRVGLSGFKHKTVETMIDGIRDALQDPAVAPRLTGRAKPVQAIRKIQSGDTKVVDPTGFVTETIKNEDVDEALQKNTHEIVAGTVWLFAPDLNKRPQPELDVIFIDEAGQMPLANALAAATSAKSVVLVGDPQQLAQPGKGAHPLLPAPADELFPRASDASALQHVLAGRPTIPSEEGIFLDVTFRLHPEICRFISEAVYEGRLEPSDNCRNQAVTLANGKRETGIRWCPVEHLGNTSSSVEERDAIQKIVSNFKGASITSKDGTTHPFTAADDIMIVAPYNSQVNKLRQALPDLRVGTVDMFQGLEAPIVIVSLVASSAEDIPRGLDFLYSTNRLNVAVSRAKTLCIVVGSPQLLIAKCKSVHQLQLVNVLCKYVEMAERWILPK